MENGTKFKKYTDIRHRAKSALVNTGLFSVYAFEEKGASTDSALNEYTNNLLNSDVCVFFIDNKDDIGQGVENEINTAKSNQIPSLFYFCDKNKKTPTKTQLSLNGEDGPKYKIVSSAENFINSCPQDLIEDVLSRSKRTMRAVKTKYEPLDLNTKENNVTSKILLNKKVLADPICRSYFYHLIFGGKFELKESHKKNFDYYCFKFLKLLFEGRTIEDFNMELFINSLRDILPSPYFEISKNRWMSNQEYYQENFKKSISSLNNSFELAKKNNVESWIEQDILIDLRNRINDINNTENKYDKNNYGSLELEKINEVLYFPSIDRKEKEILEWIERERQDNETLSYSSWKTYGDLSFLSDNIADIFYQSMIFGSFTHIIRTYELIQKLTYQLSSTTYSPNLFTLLLKTSILSLRKNDLDKIIRHFSTILNNMTSNNANEIYLFSNNAKPSHETFKYNLIAMSEIGYYLSDVDFKNHWNSLKTKINSWIKNNNSMVSLENTIFDCLRNISKRIDKNYIVEFCLEILNSESKRYYSDCLSLLNSGLVNFKIVSPDNIQKLISYLIDYKKVADSYDIDLIKGILTQLSKSVTKEVQKSIDLLVKQSWPNFYLKSYMIETNLNKESVEIFISSKINEIKKINSIKQSTGIYISTGTTDFLEVEKALTNYAKPIDTKILDIIFKESYKTISHTQQSMENKISAYRLLIFLIHFDSNVKRRNISIVQNCLDLKNIKANNSFMSNYSDDKLLLLSHSLLLEALGKKTNISQIVTELVSRKSQIDAINIFSSFLYTNNEKLSTSSRISSIFLQCAFLWKNSDDLDVRWNNIHLLIKLFSKKNYQKDIGLIFLNVMQNDNPMIKSQIMYKLDYITVLNKSLGKKISTLAKEDNNYIIRNILNH